MSFLKELTDKRIKLKPTITVITYCDGTKIAISGDNVPEKIISNSPGFIIDTKPDKIPACIIENFLYFGSQDSVDWENIEKFKLTHIISIGIKIPSFDTQSGQQLNIINHFIECLDVPETKIENLINYFIQLLDDIQANGGICLVHCNAGVSRSATFIIGYLIRKSKYTFEDAYEFVKSRRQCIRPNDGFLKQLKLL